jgi:hypothetical protein
MPSGFITVTTFRRLLLWPWFRQLGQCSAGRWIGFIGLRVSVRFFSIAALGRMAARRFRRMEWRFFIALMISAAISPPTLGGFFLIKINKLRFMLYYF